MKSVSAKFEVEKNHNIKLKDIKGDGIIDVYGSVASVRIKYKNLSNFKVSPPIYRMI